MLTCTTLLCDSKQWNTEYTHTHARARSRLLLFLRHNECAIFYSILVVFINNIAELDKVMDKIIGTDLNVIFFSAIKCFVFRICVSYEIFQNIFIRKFLKFSKSHRDLLFNIQKRFIESANDYIFGLKKNKRFFSIKYK